MATSVSTGTARITFFTMLMVQKSSTPASLMIALSLKLRIMKTICSLCIYPNSIIYDGLTLVEKDGKLMYIDHSGAAVWEER